MSAITWVETGGYSERTSAPDSDNPYRAGDCLARGTHGGKWASTIVIASYGHCVDYGLFFDDCMDAARIVRGIAVSLFNVQAVQHV